MSRAVFTSDVLDISISISTRKTNSSVFLVLMLMPAVMSPECVNSENCTRQISGFVLLMFLLMLMFMSWLFSLVLMFMLVLVLMF